MSSNGKRMTLLKFGALDLKMQDLTLLLMLQRESNIWMKSKNQWFLLSNGPLNKVSFVKKTWEEWDSTLVIANSTPILSTEVEVKLCPLLEDFIMLWKLSESHLYLNQFSSVKSQLQWNQWVVSIKHWTQEEEKLSNKTNLLEPHSVKLKHIYLSLNLSVSQELLEETLKEKLSHKMCSTIGL